MHTQADPKKIELTDKRDSDRKEPAMMLANTKKMEPTNGKNLDRKEPTILTVPFNYPINYPILDELQKLEKETRLHEITLTANKALLKKSAIAYEQLPPNLAEITSSQVQLLNYLRRVLKAKQNYVLGQGKAQFFSSSEFPPTISTELDDLQQALQPLKVQVRKLYEHQSTLIEKLTNKYVEVPTRLPINTVPLPKERIKAAIPLLHDEEKLIPGFAIPLRPMQPVQAAISAPAALPLPINREKLKKWESMIEPFQKHIVSQKKVIQKQETIIANLDNKDPKQQEIIGIGILSLAECRIVGELNVIKATWIKTYLQHIILQEEIIYKHRAIIKDLDQKDLTPQEAKNDKQLSLKTSGAISTPDVFAIASAAEDSMIAELNDLKAIYQKRIAAQEEIIQKNRTFLANLHQKDPAQREAKNDKPSPSPSSGTTSALGVFAIPSAAIGAALPANALSTQNDSRPT